ncbi:hypothetical protein M0R45_038108 [Rubus argutus]|uniref:Uncharacterized protein n=1 Tax=Rubus argutus TaxID=59490 RepID=A0AAW1W496_RUBAR
MSVESETLELRTSQPLTPNQHSDQNSCAYGNSHQDDGFDPKALPVIQNINFREVFAENVTIPAQLDGMANDPFKGICMSNVSISLSAKPAKLLWNCT